MTSTKIMSLPKGTKVKIVTDDIETHEEFKNGGELTFQSREQKSKDEYLFGIKVSFGACYMFKASLYELIN